MSVILPCLKIFLTDPTYLFFVFFLLLMFGYIVKLVRR